MGWGGGKNAGAGPGVTGKQSGFLETAVLSSSSSFYFYMNRLRTDEPFSSHKLALTSIQKRRGVGGGHCGCQNAKY